MLTEYKSIQKDRMADILNAILSSKQITRGRLSKELRLSPSSIAKYIKTLKELGLVRESGQDISTGGGAAPTWSLIRKLGSISPWCLTSPPSRGR